MLTSSGTTTCVRDNHSGFSDVLYRIGSNGSKNPAVSGGQLTLE